jgi:hypothetical protein
MKEKHKFLDKVYFYETEHILVHHLSITIRMSMQTFSTLSRFDCIKAEVGTFVWVKVEQSLTTANLQRSHSFPSAIHVQYTRLNNPWGKIPLGKLYGLIDKATVKVKTDRIVITLFKKKKIQIEDDSKKENGEDASAKSAEQTFEEWKTIGAHSYSDSDDYMD